MPLSSSLIGILDLSVTDNQRLVIVQAPSNELVGFHVSSQIRTVQLPIKAEALAPSEEFRADYLRASFATQERTLVIPNIPQIINGS